MIHIGKPLLDGVLTVDGYKGSIHLELGMKMLNEPKLKTD